MLKRNLNLSCFGQTKVGMEFSNMMMTINLREDTGARFVVDDKGYFRYNSLAKNLIKRE